MDEIISKLNSTNVADSDKLSFAGLGLKLDTGEQAKDIADKIKAFKNLVALELSGNTLGVDAAKEIGKALECQSNLKYALWRDMFTGRLKQEIPKALNFLSSGLMLASAQLVELDLSDNAFGPIGVEGILALLRSSVCYSLEELKLNNNGLGITGGKALAASLLDCHKSSSEKGKPLALKVFISGRNRLENPGATALAEVFKTIGTLENISMPQNGINHEGITALANAFSHNSNLTTVNLNDNTFTEVGADAMAKAMPTIQKLKSINFGDCLIRTGGAEAIAKSISKSHVDLEELVLSFNEIRKDGGIAIVQALGNKPKLSRLEIDGNQYGEEAIELIKTELESIGKLNTVSSEDEDEGDNEDDDDEYEDDDKSDEPDDEDVSENFLTQVAVQNPLFKSHDEVSKLSVADFLASPDILKFNRLEQEKDFIQRVLEHLNPSEPEEYVKNFFMISQIVTSKTDEYYKIRPLTDALMKKACCLAEEGSTSRLTNSILSHFDLIKTEVKSNKFPINLMGPFLLLAYSIDQSYFLKPVCRTLKFFLTNERNQKHLQSGADEVLKVLDKHGIM